MHIKFVKDPDPVSLTFVNTGGFFPLCFMTVVQLGSYPISCWLLAIGALPATALGGWDSLPSVSIYFPHGTRQVQHTGLLCTGALHPPPVGMLHSLTFLGCVCEVGSKSGFLVPVH